MTDTCPHCGAKLMHRIGGNISRFDCGTLVGAETEEVGLACHQFQIGKLTEQLAQLRKENATLERQVNIDTDLIAAKDAEIERIRTVHRIECDSHDGTGMDHDTATAELARVREGVAKWVERQRKKIYVDLVDSEELAELAALAAGEE